MAQVTFLPQETATAIFPDTVAVFAALRDIQVVEKKSTAPWDNNHPAGCRCYACK